ncbi:hypothetical protein [Wolbachia endosymbiont (group A) of Clivina fossor]|uniref:hypothetical protein n=1 Tax=Wolbachia endosymbiont (group A) of Clivina fossor TaxID=3066133 RepID=UPI003132D877
MSGKKHVFKMVPGKSLVISEGMTCYPGKNVCLGTSFSGRDNADVSRPYKIAKLAFIPLNDKSEEVLTLNVNFCQFHNGMYTCLNESGQSLNANNWYNRDATNNSLIYLNDQLVNVVIPILNNNETNEKECFPPITGGLSEFIVYSICLPNNEVWYN